jgi:hypothetical protein
MKPKDLEVVLDASYHTERLPSFAFAHSIENESAE